MTRIFPNNCSRETDVFVEKRTWPITYLPSKMAESRGIVMPNENSNVEWACVGCAQEHCINRKADNIA